jgi:hypothetical protein
LYTVLTTVSVVTIAASNNTSADAAVALSATSETVSARMAPVRSGVKSHADAAAAAAVLDCKVTSGLCRVMDVGVVNAVAEEMNIVVAMSVIRCNLVDLFGRLGGIRIGVIAVCSDGCKLLKSMTLFSTVSLSALSYIMPSNISIE